MIAGAGLAVALGAESFAEVVTRTVVVISPGSSDGLLRQVIIEGGAADEGSKRAEVVVVLGLGTAFLAALRRSHSLSAARTASMARPAAWVSCGGKQILWGVSWMRTQTRPVLTALATRRRRTEYLCCGHRCRFSVPVDSLK